MTLQLRYRSREDWRARCRHPPGESACCGYIAGGTPKDLSLWGKHRLILRCPGFADFRLDGELDQSINAWRACGLHFVPSSTSLGVRRMWKSINRDAGPPLLPVDEGCVCTGQCHALAGRTLDNCSVRTACWCVLVSSLSLSPPPLQLGRPEPTAHNLNNIEGRLSADLITPKPVATSLWMCFPVIVGCSLTSHNHLQQSCETYYTSIQPLPMSHLWFACGANAILSSFIIIIIRVPFSHHRQSHPRSHGLTHPHPLSEWPAMAHAHRNPSQPFSPTTFFSSLSSQGRQGPTTPPAYPDSASSGLLQTQLKLLPFHFTTYHNQRLYRIKVKRKLAGPEDNRQWRGGPRAGCPIGCELVFFKTFHSPRALLFGSSMSISFQPYGVPRSFGIQRALRISH